MRILVDLEARRDCAYDSTYHHKVRGRIWEALRGTEYGQRHDSNTPSGFTYSNPFPWGDMESGDARKLLISAVEEELLATVAADLLDNTELNIGEMPFEVTDISPIGPDVGSPGTSGVLETSTGVIAKVPPQFEKRSDDYKTYWEPEDSMEPFKQYTRDQLERKLEYFQPSVPTPSERDLPLFEEYELLKTFGLPVTVTEGVTENVLCTKWRFKYTVQNDTHRNWLNMILDTGIGGKSPLGFGFVNKRLEDDE